MDLEILCVNRNCAWLDICLVYLFNDLLVRYVALLVTFQLANNFDHWIVLGIVSSLLSIVYHIVYYFKFKLRIEMQKSTDVKAKNLFLFKR